MATALQLAVWAANAKGSAEAGGVVHEGLYGTDQLKGAQSWGTRWARTSRSPSPADRFCSPCAAAAGAPWGWRGRCPTRSTRAVLIPSLRGRHWGTYIAADLAGHNGQPDRHAVVLLKDQVEASDPMFAAGGLLVSADAHRVGTLTEQNRVLTGYRGTVSAARVAKSVAAGGPGSGMLPWLKQSGMQAGTFEVWLGPDHLPYRASVSGDFSDGAFLATFTWSDYGAPVRVTAPPGLRYLDYGGCRTYEGQNGRVNEMGRRRPGCTERRRAVRGGGRGDGATVVEPRAPKPGSPHRTGTSYTISHRMAGTTMSAVVGGLAAGLVWGR